MRRLGPFLRDSWRLSWPYFWSEEKWSARGLLASVILLQLGLVGMNVVLNFWNRDFFDALQQKDWHAFVNLLFLYRSGPGGFMPGFVEVAVVYILVAVYATWLNQFLEIRWRRWLTNRFLNEWTTDRAYYRISFVSDQAQTGTDNPDQRIAEDIRDFINSALSLGISFMSNVVTIFSFLGILWTLSGMITLFGINIPGYMVWVAILYSVLGTWLTHMVGRPLAALRFRQQRVEADFRYALVRFRENMEAIALFRGEGEEKGNLHHRFHHVIGNWWAIMQRIKMVNALTSGYGLVANIFPFIVAAPRYFRGEIMLGGLTQTADAFGQVQGSLSWFVNQYPALAQWYAITERLATFQRAIADARKEAATQDLAVTTVADGSVHVHDLTVALPNGTKLLEHADLTLTPGHSVVVTGRSGSGKSTLFRSLAGIWPYGSGRVELPKRSFFLPQRPYIPLGTLRHVVTYPHPHDTYDHDRIAEALTDAGLGSLVDRLDRDENWAARLSGGEQQRIALTRALLAEPEWIFLDEATANLDPEAEAHLYETLKRRLPRTTLVSIAHNPTVATYHDERLVLRREEGKPGELVAGAVPVIATAGE